MRALMIAAILLASGCASAAAQQGEPVPVWRMNTEHLAADRARARGCLEQGSGSCEDVVQRACRGAYNEDAQDGALERQCNWRAIAAWEDEMNDLLGRLRAGLAGRDLDNLEASQRAWEASMLADVGLPMAMFEGGTMSAQLGAQTRARATEQRVRYLHSVLELTNR